MEADMNGTDDTMSPLSSTRTTDNINDDDDVDDEDDDIAKSAVISLILEDEFNKEINNHRPRRGGSHPGKAPNKKRDFQRAADILIQHYFSGSDSVYDENDFRRRFRMDRNIFEKIYAAIEGEGRFAQRYDCTNKVGIHPLVRITACLRVLAYGNCPDAYDESFQLAESTLIESVKEFASKVVEKFGALYLNCPPRQAELERILRINKSRGFPGLVGCWDCKHFAWKNCPVYLAGQFTGKGKALTIVLEAVCDPDLFIYYSFFGSPGSLNDINILHKSSIVSALLSRQFDLRTNAYKINENRRDWMYFLVDGIYPPWSIFMSTIPNPIGKKEELYKDRQESVRKDIERAFGAIVQQFQIIQTPFRSWTIEDNQPYNNKLLYYPP